MNTRFCLTSLCKISVTNITQKLQLILNPHERRLDRELHHERINWSKGISVWNNLENQEDTQRSCTWIGLIKTNYFYSPGRKIKRHDIELKASRGANAP